MEKSEMKEIFNFVRPGTRLREGLDSILDGKKGALIVVGCDEEVGKVLDGGFFLNCDYTPERLFELSKMDGAIVLDENIEKILYANVHLQPDKRYTTDESGTRHRTAQRIGKQLNRLTIAISERKRVLTLYKGEIRYKLRSLLELTSEAAQGLNTLERYRNVLEKSLGNLTILELDDMVTVEDVCIVLQKFEMLKRIKKEAFDCIIELGTEGRLISLQLEDLLRGIKEEKEEFLRDYYYCYCNKEEDTKNIELEISGLDNREMLDLVKISTILGFGKSVSRLDNRVSPKGYRILNKFSKINDKEIESLIESFGDLSKIQVASADELVEKSEISKFKANSIKRGFARLKFTVGLDK